MMHRIREQVWRLVVTTHGGLKEAQLLGYVDASDHSTFYMIGQTQENILAVEPRLGARVVRCTAYLARYDKDGRAVMVVMGPLEECNDAEGTTPAAAQ